MQEYTAQVQRLRQALDDENISYFELVEIEDIARELHIEITEDMTSWDVLAEIENKLNSEGLTA